MEHTGKLAWIYARIDAPEDQHGVLKEQEKELFDYAGQMGLTVAGSSSDLGSGLDFERPGLARLTAAAQESRFDILLMKNLGRLGRDMAQTFDLLRQLDGLGILVLSPLEGEIRLDAEPWNTFGLTLEQEG